MGHEGETGGEREEERGEEEERVKERRGERCEGGLGDLRQGQAGSDSSSTLLTFKPLPPHLPNRILR